MATEKRERQRANRQLRYQQEVKQQRRDTTKRRAVIGVAAVVGALALVIGLAALGGAFSSDDDADGTGLPSIPSSTLPADVSTPPTIAGEPETLPNGFTLGTTDCPAADRDGEPVRFFASAPSMCIDPAASYTATFATSAGDIVVALDTANTPGTVNNFVTLARYGYYDGTPIFRADPSIDIIQGGGQDNSADPGYSIPDEGSGFTYEPGQLVMARTAAPNSAGGQWFFTGGPNAANLNGQGTYVVFGTVTEGLDVIQSIIASAGGAGGQTPDPVPTISSVTISEGAAATPSTTADGPATTAGATATTGG